MLINLHCQRLVSVCSLGTEWLKANQTLIATAQSLNTHSEFSLLLNSSIFASLPVFAASSALWLWCCGAEVSCFCQPRSADCAKNQEKPNELHFTLFALWSRPTVAFVAFALIVLISVVLCCSCKWEQLLQRTAVSNHSRQRELHDVSAIKYSL